MNDDQVRRVIDEIERALRHEDPGLCRRARWIHRRETMTVLAVVTLLTAGTVLLTVGLATLSWQAWCAGLVTLVVSVVVDERYHHRLRRSP